jgi:hypothetical protein
MRIFKKQPKLYTSTAVENFIDKYIEKGGELITIEEGTLGWRTVLLRCHGFKTAIIKERFINSWSSGHTVRMYNKCPKKYLQID